MSREYELICIGVSETTESMVEPPLSSEIEVFCFGFGFVPDVPVGHFFPEPARPLAGTISIDVVGSLT